MNLILVGCNHRSAPVTVRERLAFDGPRLEQALAAMPERFPNAEFVILSTCNRVELYAAAEGDRNPPAQDQLVRFLSDFHQLPLGQFQDYLYCMNGRQAVQHLFEVAASLDSLVPGEGQIQAQVKHSYRLAHQRGVTGPLTNALFQKALAVAKKVHSGTKIAHKKVSVSSVAVEFACEIFQAAHFPRKTVLVIGAGKMGELTLEHLAQLHPGRILVTNRSPEKAADLATRWNGQPAPFDQLDDLLVQADLILSTTGSPQPLVDKDRFARVMARRANSPVFIVDIAVPRDFDPAVGELQNVYLYNIDDLERQRSLNLQQRQREVAKGRAIVQRETVSFLREVTYQRHSGPVITQLRQEWDRRREAELARLFAQCPELSERDRAAIAHSFERFENQLLHQPLSTLRSAAANGPPHGLLKALKRLFGLGQ